MFNPLIYIKRFFNGRLANGAILGAYIIDAAISIIPIILATFFRHCSVLWIICSIFIIQIQQKGIIQQLSLIFENMENAEEKIKEGLKKDILYLGKFAEKNYKTLLETIYKDLVQMSGKISDPNMLETSKSVLKEIANHRYTAMKKIYDLHDYSKYILADDDNYMFKTAGDNSREVTPKEIDQANKKLGISGKRLDGPHYKIVRGIRNLPEVVASASCKKD
ncbi:hypothetical protein KAFR_0K00120 [Kazachstania africana CBS 2517]|uniref:Uncharacterized protein n=1 Tax=Kazachstania africana (strain ATCC 22294 / BCRC 22015 / CBS 2517 / CECT 1963 / NBRC 1671 / NRRL Y-8276) TaxID=1071382 RepID=H2B165_KAZAF|nr:hypothetical protein KAFR_0K00120 [Kazachstania africana CBS 2517]CCF60365.1 hypothetical protein KAFR_0K00120 [Kazachstania africana CBS 2517]